MSLHDVLQPRMNMVIIVKCRRAICHREVNRKFNVLDLSTAIFYDSIYWEIDALKIFDGPFFSLFVFRQAKSNNG
jgi:hypothetical protein